MDQIQHLDDSRHLAKESPISEQVYVRYIWRVFAILAGGALLVAAFIALIDPYRLSGLLDVQGINHIKPLPGQYREQIKSAQARALQPNALMLGNSRIEVGMDPESPQLRSRGYLAYNLALAGTSLATAQAMHVQMRGQLAAPSTAIVGLEFLDFLVSPKVKSLPHAKPSEQMPWQWRFDTAFSMKSLSDAWRTLRLQQVSDPETMTARGHTPLLEYRKFARQEGYYTIFQQRALENAKTISRKPQSLHDAAAKSEPLSRLDQMLRTMAQDGTEVHLVIYPYHVQLLAMFQEAGLGNRFDEWKTLLVHRIEVVRKDYPSARIMLWDFSGYSSIQCERIPSPNDRQTITQYYWEGGHFKSSVGELMLQRILGGQSIFGVSLTSENLEVNRQRIHKERERCETTYPEVFAGARSLINGAR